MKKETRNPKKLRRQANAAAKAAIAAGKPVRRPARLSVMAKPVGPACNLRCRYCFYLEKHALFAGGAGGRMSEQVLEAYTRKYIQAEPSNEVTFHWQGGEPTLAGIEFFRAALRLQRRHAGGKRIHNTLQTNGTLLDDEWGRLLREHRFLVGLSIDGPRNIHDANRTDASGGGSFEAVMRGLDVLRRHNVEFNVLACVTPFSASRPLEVYEFFRAAGAKFAQFMPVVERLPDQAARELGLQLAVGVRAGEAAGAVQLTPWSIGPEEYGEFLCRIFDTWVRRDVGTFFVMNFEWAMAGYLDLPPQVCFFMPVCGHSLVLEQSGDVYACDHYVYPEHRRGNILTDDLQDMVQSAAQCEFGLAKSESLPKCCQDCPVLSACRGECPKRRFVRSPDGEPGLNYLCAGYKRFFTHAAPYLEAIKRLRQVGRPASDITGCQVLVVS